MRRFLHVGCGLGTKEESTREFAGDDWQEIRLDIGTRARPDFAGSLTDLSAIADNALDGLFSCRSLELLHREDVPLALGEFRRVLKPDGFAVLTCPDLQSLCALVAEGGEAASGAADAIDLIFGHRPGAIARDSVMPRRTGFTKQTLLDALRQSGFEVAIAQRRGSGFNDIWAIAGKLHKSAEAMTDLARRHFPGLSADSLFTRTPAAA